MQWTAHPSHFCSIFLSTCLAHKSWQRCVKFLPHTLSYCATLILLFGLFVRGNEGAVLQQSAGWTGFLSPTPKNDYSACFQNYRFHNQLYRCHVDLAPGICRALHCQVIQWAACNKKVLCVVRLAKCRMAVWRPKKICHPSQAHHWWLAAGWAHSQDQQESRQLPMDVRKVTPQVCKTLCTWHFSLQGSEGVKRHLCFSWHCSILLWL